MSEHTCYIGVDLGTGGIRCLAVNAAGTVLAESRRMLAAENTATAPGHSEQDPREWLTLAEAALDELFAGLPGHLPSSIAVTSTSGTVLAVDDRGRPTSPALMHNDMRATLQARRCESVFGHTVSPTFGLPKMLWLQDNGFLHAGGRLLHATDLINEWLCGRPVATDFTNAMKSGVDLATLDWPPTLTDAGLDVTGLPPICSPGAPLGPLNGKLIRRWQLRAPLTVVAGATDSNAAFYACGASAAGQWNTTIGTTLAVKGLTTMSLSDPLGRIYCHRHPDLLWLPGGASNAGGEMLRHWFAGENLAALDAAIGSVRCRDHVVYPSIHRGERLPVASPDSGGFVIGDRNDRPAFYRACLEGVAFVERWIYELLAELGAPVGSVIYATGGAARSATWSQIRADVLGRELRVPACAESAMGSAILAAAGASGQTVSASSAAMVQIAASFAPDAAMNDYYQNRYAAFRAACKKEWL